jgi:CubicO group peptidase (beta-lactamase class C family)
MELLVKSIRRLSIPVFFLFLLPSCYVVRSVLWYPPGVTDYRHFHADTVRNQAPVSGFHTRPTNWPVKISTYFAVKDTSGCFEDLLDKSRTVAFLVIRNDSLIYSRYQKGYGDSSLFSSYSMAKSFVSALTGIALREGYIRSLDQPVTDFFPELAGRGYSKVTLKDLLTMKSGIGFREKYNNPFGDVSRVYYGRNVGKFILGLEVKTEPGTEYSYQSGNTQLLAMVVEKATGMPISRYMEEKLWKPLGMGQAASWSVDGRKHHEVKAFCCINASAGDYARFGQLYLDKGYRDGKSIVPENWVEESLTIRNDSKDSRGYPYTYFWRVRKNGEFFSYGVNGQYIYVSPEKKVVIVRIGEKSGGINWPEFFHLLIQDL